MGFIVALIPRPCGLQEFRLPNGVAAFHPQVERISYYVGPFLQFHVISNP